MKRSRTILLGVAILPVLVLAGLSAPRDAERATDPAAYARLDAITSPTRPSYIDRVPYERLDAVRSGTSVTWSNSEAFERLDAQHAYEGADD